MNEPRGSKQIVFFGAASIIAVLVALGAAFPEAFGNIAGAALDTFHEEPLPTDSLLWDLPNVLISPHMGADTPHYMERMTDLLCDNLQRYALGKPLRNVIDPIERY